MISGVVARVDWHWYRAAAIEGFTIQRVADQVQLSATVVVKDAYNITRRPLVFVVPHKHGEWRWPIDAMTLVGDRLSARLGEPLP